MYINCDMGESFGPWKKGNDESVMPLIDWANIACGGHAGDPDTMVRTLQLAQEHDVQAGAHPGYPDPRNFGRVKLDWPVRSVVNEIQGQVGRLLALSKANGVSLRHVKPHGALYNTMMADDALLVALAEGVAALDSGLTFVLQATPDRERHQNLLQHTGLALAFEAFADRRYDPDGRLTSRAVEGAVIDDVGEAERHVRSMLEGTVETRGGPLSIQAETLCVHGDNPSALAVVERVRSLLPRQR